MSGVEIVKIGKNDDGMRLNRWFLKYYPSLSLGRLQKLLRTKQIKVNGARAEASLKLAAGDELRLPPLQAEKETAGPRAGVLPQDAEKIRQMVIYEDPKLIALNKPAGLAVQGGTGTTRHVDGMLAALASAEGEIPRLVHRIDKETSGLLVVARSRQTAEELTKAFRERELHKTYLALVWGGPANEQGEIRLKLEKHGEKMAEDPEGKPAVTTYKVLDRVGNKFSLIEASPLTGRTHQIRVSMEALGCPIVGDDKYFGRERQKFNPVSGKLFLHAYKIDLSELYNKKMVLTAPLPAHFKAACDQLGISLKE